MNIKTRISVEKTEKEITIESVVYDEKRRFIVVVEGQEYILYQQDDQWYYSADTVLKDEWLKAIVEQLDLIKIEYGQNS